MIYGAMNFPVMPVVEEIQTFAELGFDYLELAMDPPEAHYSIVSENRSAITKTLENHGELIDQGNVHITLGVFDDLCRFGDPDR